MQSNGSFNIPLKRRSFLKILGISAAISPLWRPSPAWGQQTDLDIFMRVSEFLTGRSALDEVLAKRIYIAFTATDRAFNVNLKKLDMFIAHNAVKASDLQKKLDTGNTDLTALPRRILNAWYQGIIDDTTVITYENALMFSTVDDILVIPSYSPHKYGYWSSSPELQDGR